MPNPIKTAATVQGLIGHVRREVQSLDWGDDPRPRPGWEDLDALLRIADREIARIIYSEGAPSPEAVAPEGIDRP